MSQGGQPSAPAKAKKAPVKASTCNYCVTKRKPSTARWLAHPEAPDGPICATCLRRERRRFVINYAILGLSITEIARRMGLDYKMVRRDLNASIKLDPKSPSIPENAEALREMSRLRTEDIIRRAYGIASSKDASYTVRLRALDAIRKANSQLNDLLALRMVRESEREEEKEEARPAGRSTSDAIRRRLRMVK